PRLFPSRFPPTPELKHLLSASYIHFLPFGGCYDVETRPFLLFFSSSFLFSPSPLPLSLPLSLLPSSPFPPPPPSLVHSISMNEGEEAFIHHAQLVIRYGADMVVMA
ncbi:hypothetical protein, partial [Enterobacter quasiroggenkampii]|uniref:hypothetical protein n=1 Tax=Enterobacter quasiroggenkampii TaxID=2497436 RepID=UPI0021D2375A